MWNRIQDLRWFLRWPIKWLVLAVTVFLVSFPNPALFVRHVEHWRDPNAMIQPDLPELQEWVEQVKAKVTSDMEPPEALKTVEKFVYKNVKYQWDWVTWGSADYLPTLAEVMEKKAEDCDGRAVVAASLLRNLGYKAELVSDFAHVWVKTDKGETMGPGKAKSVTATDAGWLIDWKAVAETLPRSLAYSISPFPLVRELIVLLVIWLLLLRRGTGRWAPLLCLLVMFDGLMFLRLAGTDWRNPNVPVQWWGFAQLAIPIVILLFAGCRVGRADKKTQPAGAAA